MNAVCLEVNVSSAKMNILLDGAITANYNLCFCHAKRYWTIYSAGLDSFHWPLSMHRQSEGYLSYSPDETA